MVCSCGEEYCENVRDDDLHLCCRCADFFYSDYCPECRDIEANIE